MAITIKDFVATLLAGISAYIYYAQLNAISLPLIDSQRATILALAIVGMIVCEYGIPREYKFSLRKTLLNLLTIIFVVLTFLSLISVKATINTYLIGIIISIWVIATFRHMLNI